MEGSVHMPRTQKLYSSQQLNRLLDNLNHDQTYVFVNNFHWHRTVIRVFVQIKDMNIHTFGEEQDSFIENGTLITTNLTLQQY